MQFSTKKSCLWAICVVLVDLSSPDAAGSLLLMCFLLILVLLIFEVCEALAVIEFAISAIFSTGAPAPEIILSGMDTLAVNHGVNEAKVARQHFVVHLVHHRNRDRFVSGKGAQLAPVAVPL